MAAPAVAAQELPPLSLYVHLPWCVQKCPYCDFNSHSLRGELPEAGYIDALLADLAFECQELVPRRLHSIFFGGGTPSLFSPHSIDRILRAAQTQIGLAPDCEITLEANPGTADAGHFSGYRSAGVNRLSIGVQSFDDAKLRVLGRIHDAAAARQAVAMARNAGFDNINLDLMFALPEQTPAQAVEDLRHAIALEPEHISWYHLTLEPNTAFAANPPPLPDADAGADIHDAGSELLQAAGYAGYETSAWARPARQGAHNLNYWRFGDYLGIGAGAHGKRSVRRGGALHLERRARLRHPRAFQEAAGTARALQSQQWLADEALPFEFAMNALRLHEGFTWQQLTATTGLPAARITAAVNRAEALGLVEVDAHGVRPSVRGRAHLNSLIGLFLS